MPPIRPLLSSVLGVALGLAVVLGGLIAVELLTTRQLNPTGRAETLRIFLTSWPDSEQFAMTDAGGQPHVIAYGPKGSFLLASGPSAYVYDASGRLVDWSRDIGDDPVFDERWDAQQLRNPARRAAPNAVRAIAATQSHAQ